MTATLRLPASDRQRVAADIARRLGMRASRDEPLAPHTTMRVGGPADLFVEAHNLFELRGIVRYARTRDLPLFLVGRGSDLVISDEGIGGLVVLVRALGQRLEGRRVVAEAGLPMARVATLTREAGLSGLEFGLAIPGTVGGAVWANAGAHGSDMRGVLVEAQVVTADGSEAVLGPDQLGMGYRDTRLKHAPAGRPEVVVSATFELVAAEPATITERLDDIRRWRQAHQPIGQKSAGSVFRNPEGDSAGRLIDELGLKGTQVGGAVVSPKHANFIVNTGTASARDVWHLAELVRQRVREVRGIDLRYEVEFVGHWPEQDDGEPPPGGQAIGAALGIDGGGGMSVTGSQPSGRRVALPPTAISVLFGGPSAEHDVSLVSGRSIARALLERGHDVSAWLVDLDGRWWRLPRTALDPALPAAAFRDPGALGAPAPRAAAAALEELAGSRPIVFPAMHGPFGEDGQVQALLELAGLTYCGAGPAASAVGMDKTLFKRICGSLELPVLPWLEVRAPEYAADAGAVEQVLATFASSLPDPRLVCKPARLGSSIGISIVHHPADQGELGAAIREAFRHDDLILLEPYLDHPRELETSVLGNWRADTVAYGPGEVVPGREFYDYVAKYVSDDSRTQAQADLEPELAAGIRAAAVEAFLAIGACGYARVDMLLSGDGIPFISEINTIPGFTPISLFPRMTAQGGYDFGDTCERIVELALERAASRQPWQPRPVGPS